MDAQNPERRHSTIRRQLNEGFLGADGTWSPAKTIAIAGQLALLYHLSVHFTLLIPHWDSLTAVALLIIAPDTFKKWLAMKYGGSSK